MDYRRKEPTANLRTYYTIFLQIAVIAVLLIFIVATKIEFQSSQQNVNLVEEQEVLEMEEVIQTDQEEIPAPPPKPQVPVEVPNDEIIEDQEINLDADMNLNDPLDMPPPPDEEEEEEEDFFMAVEEMPKIKGGQEWLYDNVEYPERARKSNIEGRVTVQFIVTENGKVEDPKVIRGIGGGCDQAALEVIKKAEFTPGRQRGKPVRVKMSQPIVFRLTN
ncbi:energy transducer TonB [Aliifodinibius salicampi]|uniref:Energy transducer TonB n=1 Tax=Fodinibius salicampi TaxID=1920655 RepID=A0ABT3Q2G1_9BACT|nr:energy transducer TonB [Fodinibius salicampi]MCW9714241.1 energy transducer TonB [Fodinibius salicampi]